MFLCISVVYVFKIGKATPHTKSKSIKIKAFISSMPVTGTFEFSKKNMTNLSLNNLATVPSKRHNNCESTVVAHSKA